MGGYYPLGWDYLDENGCSGTNKVRNSGPVPEPIGCVFFSVRLIALKKKEFYFKDFNNYDESVLFLVWSIV